MLSIGFYGIRSHHPVCRRPPGNEPHRLTILREHQRRLADQIDALTACLEMINFKVQIYTDSLDAGDADPIWAPAQPA